MTEQCVIIIPTFEEALTLEHQVRDVRAHTTVDILIVDDNSTDGTADIADQLARELPGIHVLHRPHKTGLGSAYCAGFAWALARDYTLIGEMDADGSHRASDLPTLLDATAHADVIIGSRWIPGGSVINWPRHRWWLSRAGNTYTRIMLGLTIADATAGFRLFHAHTLASLDLTTIASHGYCFQVDMTWRMVQAGYTIREVPITFVERTHGHSKMSGRIVREALWKVTTWGLQRHWQRLRTTTQFTRP